MLGADPGAFAAVGAASGNMECADDVEHIFLEGVCCRLLGNAGIGLSKTHLFAGAGGTYVAAGVAADALGKLASPELKAFVGCHCFKLCNGVKAVAVEESSSPSSPISSSYTTWFLRLQTVQRSEERLFLQRSCRRREYVPSECLRPRRSGDTLDSLARIFFDVSFPSQGMPIT